MATLDHSFRILLGSFLEKTGLSRRRFGMEALGDPSFVRSLARGRRPGLRTADRLLVFMGLEPMGPAFRREVEAFLGATGTKGYVLGELVLKDPSFVRRLRRGDSFQLETVAHVRCWMAVQALEDARAAMRAAVAGVPLLDGDLGAEDDGSDPHGERNISSSICQGKENHMNETIIYLSAREAAAHLGLSTRTLDRYRVSGDGPVFLRFGGRVRYLREDIDAWARTRRRRSTSDDGTAIASQ